jgi:hypothetical protein
VCVRSPYPLEHGRPAGVPYVAARIARIPADGMSGRPVFAELAAVGVAEQGSRPQPLPRKVRCDQQIARFGRMDAGKPAVESGRRGAASRARAAR